MSFWTKRSKVEPVKEKEKEPTQLECLFSDGKEHLWGQWHPVEKKDTWFPNGTYSSQFQTRYCERCFIAQMTPVLIAFAHIK